MSRENRKEPHSHRVLLNFTGETDLPGALNYYSSISQHVICREKFHQKDNQL